MVVSVEEDELRPAVDGVPKHLARGVFVAERTWGQVITGRFQDAIEMALKELFGTPG